MDKLEEFTQERDNLRKMAQMRWAALQDEKRKCMALRAENEALREDLNEYREILCNKQKQLDAIVKDNEALRAELKGAKNGN